VLNTRGWNKSWLSFRFNDDEDDSDDSNTTTTATKEKSPNDLLKGMRDSIFIKTNRSSVEISC